jgi:hypothetical protein
VGNQAAPKVIAFYTEYVSERCDLVRLNMGMDGEQTNLLGRFGVKFRFLCANVGRTVTWLPRDQGTNTSECLNDGMGNIAAGLTFFAFGAAES